MLAAALAFFCGVLSVSADSAPPMVTDSLVRELPEVSVVDVRQGNRMATAPVSATTIGRADLSRLGAVAVKSMSEAVPNLYIPDYGSRITSSIYLRGIGARMDNPSVGLTVDNVAIINKDAYDTDLPDIARVRVLRGPQSALYGRNTMAGLIDVETLSPMRYQGLRASLTAATAETFRASLGWYGRPNDKTGCSASASFNHQGGFWRNQLTGEKCDRENSGSLRLKFHWRPDSRLSLQNVLSGSLLRQEGYAYENVATGRIAYNDECSYKRFALADGLTVNRFHERFTMTSVTTFQYLDDDLLLDQDFLPLPYFTLNQRKRETAVTEDLTLKGECGAYSWLAGATGFYKHLDMKAPVVFKTTGIAELIESHRNDANPFYPVAWNGRSFPLNSDFTNPTAGGALYHRSKVSLGSLGIEAALRLEYERAALSYRSHCNTSYTIYDNPSGELPAGGWQGVGELEEVRRVGINIDDTGRLHRDFLMLLPSLSFSWQFGDGDGNLFASVAKGAKAGGFNTQMFSDVLQQRLMGIMGLASKYDVDQVVGYNPEKSWNYELGAHMAFPSANLKGAFSAFIIDCRDQQLTVFPDGTTTGRAMANAGHTRSWGFEAEAQWSPSERLGIQASYGFTEARFVRFFDGREDYRHKRLPYVPRQTLFLQAVWMQPVSSAGGMLELAADLRATGDIWWNEQNTLRQPLYALLGASASYSAPFGKQTPGQGARGKNWSVRVWAKNITGTRYDTFYFKSIGNEFIQRGRPFQAGLTMALEL